MIYLKSFFFQMMEILLFFLLLTILYYFDIINERSYAIGKFISFFLSTFYHAFTLGKNTKNMGYLVGAKYGLFLILCFFIFSLFLSSFSWKTLFYYGLILSTSILSSMFGIGFSKKNSP